MSRSSSNGNPGDSDVQKSPWFNWKLFSGLAKTLVALIILGLGLQSFYVIYFSGASSTLVDEKLSQLTDNPSQSSHDPLAIFADFTSGAWKFEDQEDLWDFRLFSSGSAPDDDSPPETTRFRDSHFDDQAVIDQFLELGIKPEDLGRGLQRWTSTGQGFELTMFTRDGVVQVLRTKLPVEQGIALLEAVPKSKVAEGSKLVLLPLLSSAKQTATRTGADGEITSAIIQLEAEKQIDIRSLWKENGWTVAPVAVIDSNAAFDSNVLNEQGTNMKFRCTKGRAIVEATFLSEPDDSNASIILTLIAR